MMPRGRSEKQDHALFFPTCKTNVAVNLLANCTVRLVGFSTHGVWVCRASVCPYIPSPARAPRGLLAARLQPAAYLLVTSSGTLARSLLTPTYGLVLFCNGTGFSLHSIRRMGTRLSYIYGSREVAVSSNGHMDQNVVDVYFSAEDRQSMMGLHNKTDFVSEVGTIQYLGRA